MFEGIAWSLGRGRLLGVLGSWGLRSGAASGPVSSMSCHRLGQLLGPGEQAQVRCMAGGHEPHAQGWKAQLMAADWAAAALCHSVRPVQGDLVVAGS